MVGKRRLNKGDGILPLKRGEGRGKGTKTLVYLKGGGGLEKGALGFKRGGGAGTPLGTMNFKDFAF